MTIYSRISGTGSFLPPRRLTNADLVAELAYRPELKHVIDIPERGLRYGHWYLDMGAAGGSR